MAMATSQNAGRTPVWTALKIRVEMEHNNGGSALGKLHPYQALVVPPDIQPTHRFYGRAEYSLNVYADPPTQGGRWISANGTSC